MLIRNDVVCKLAPGGLGAGETRELQWAQCSLELYRSRLHTLQMAVTPTASLQIYFRYTFGGPDPPAGLTACTAGRSRPVSPRHDHLESGLAAGRSPRYHRPSSTVVLASGDDGDVGSRQERLVRLLTGAPR